ncbi:MAG: acylphosphatase [Gemmatimonadota bacterium]|nr:MAG: acylphosphatase [Gemmatimonadota bacterium]
MSEGAVLAARWLVSGRVQGVGFRWYTLRHAERLGLGGWARNLPDGRVEVVAAGTAEALRELDAALREGPRFGFVENVDKDEIPHDGIAGNSFTIK